MWKGKGLRIHEGFARPGARVLYTLWKYDRTRGIVMYSIGVGHEKRVYYVAKRIPPGAHDITNMNLVRTEEIRHIRTRT